MCLGIAFLTGEIPYILFIFDLQCIYVVFYRRSLNLFQPPHNTVRYYITADAEDLECFLVNEVTGDLALRRSLLYDPCRAQVFNVSFIPLNHSLSKSFAL